MPKDFGLIGMLFIFIAVSRSLVDSGFGSALVQKRDTDQLDYNTIFYFNLFVSAVCYGVIYLSAPLISSFYNQPLLTILLRVLALKIVINAMTVVPYNILYKNLEFKKIAITNFVSLSISGTITISAAMMGLGVWSLVLQQLLNASLKNVMFLWFCFWSPGLAFSSSRLRSLFSYGSKILLASLLRTIFENIYFLVIGRFFSASALGFYSKAKNLQQQPTRAISMSISGVTFPLFSELQNDIPRLKRSIGKSIELGAFFVYPALAGLAVVAEPFVKVILTDKWLPSVPYIQLFCLVGMEFPLKPMNKNILRATGRSDLILLFEIISKSLQIILLLVTIRYGIFIILLGQIAHTWIAIGALTVISGKLIGYGLKQQLFDIAPIIFISILMGGTVYGISNTLHSDVLKIIVIPFCGIITYILLAKIFGISIFNDAVQVLKRKIGLRKP